MKHTHRLYTLLALLLMAGGATMQAQEYLPIAQKGNEWHTFETGVWQINNYVNWCSGDTLIGNVRYMKIMGTVNDSYPIFYTLLREEDGKVWKRYSIAHPETLLYDFTASVGDTLCFGDFGACFVLDIGSDYGLLWSGYWRIPDGWHCLLCFHQYGELVWQNPEYNTCSYPNDAVEENKDSEISVYPNPVRDRVVIEGIEAVEIQVYNTLGQVVKTVRGTNEIPVADLPQGVYMLRVTDADGKVYTNKITVR